MSIYNLITDEKHDNTADPGSTLMYLITIQDEVKHINLKAKIHYVINRI